MGLLQYFRRKGLTVSPTVVDASITGQLSLYQRLGGVNQQVNAAWLQAQSASYAYIYQSQPAVRMVVDFVARNVAQVSLKLYEQTSDIERNRAEDHPAALTMAHPNSFTTARQFIWNYVADFLVHDNAYIVKFRSTDAQGKPIPDAPLQLISVPPPAIALEGTGRYQIVGYRIYRWNGSTYPEQGLPPIPPEDVIHWRGYNPADSRIGISKLQTLRDVLAEESASQTANVELLKAGLSKPGYIKRPVDAPEWSEEARKRFQEGWANQNKGFPRKTPVLEEGMDFADFGITPRDAQMLEGREFTIKEVCRLYGVPLGVLGISSGQRIDLAEERRQLYADVLPPLTTELESLLDFSILEQEYGEDNYGFEFDLNEKLRGAPEVRYPAMTAAAGRPWKTVNEVRGDEGLPAIDGGDELTIPLNVALGDLPAPNVMPPQDPNGPPQDGSHRTPMEQTPPSSNGNKALHPRLHAIESRRNAYAGEYSAVLTRHFERQERVTAGSKSKALDTPRFDSELAADLLKLSKRQVDAVGTATATRIASSFNMALTPHYLEAKAQGAAEEINKTTQADIEKVGIADAFSKARTDRAPAAGMAFATDLSAWATKEALNQSPSTSHQVTISGGDCDICAPYQGTSPASEVEAWPSYHPNCNCIADVT